MVKRESRDFRLEIRHEYEYTEKVEKPRIGRAVKRKVRGKHINYWVLNDSRISGELAESVEQTSDSTPVLIWSFEKRAFWAYAGDIYSTAVDDDLAPDEVEAFIKEKEQKAGQDRPRKGCGSDGRFNRPKGQERIPP